MRNLAITADNKSYIVHRYTDYALSRMDNVEILNGFRDYFYREKMGYPINTLELEISKYCPEILEDHFSENVVGKGAEYAKNI